MRKVDNKAFCLSVVCDLLICAALLTCLACAGSYPIKNKGAAGVLFYNEPLDEETAFNTDWFPKDMYTGGTVQYSQALTLRKYVNSISSWTDDHYCDRKLFTFAGQFQVLNNDRIFYFTEDGTVYFDHCYGRLSEKGTEFLLSLKP